MKTFGGSTDLNSLHKLYHLFMHSYTLPSAVRHLGLVFMNRLWCVYVCLVYPWPSPDKGYKFQVK